MNMNKLHNECKKLGEKMGIEVINCHTNFEFHKLKNKRVVYLNDYALKNLMHGSDYQKSAKAVMKYVKSCF